MAQTNGHEHSQPFPSENSPIGNIASLKDKVALITGGSSGIGRSIAQAYAAAGAYVVSADLRPEPPSAPITAAVLNGIDQTTPTVDLVNSRWPTLRTGTRRAIYVRCDVTDAESVRNAVCQAVEQYGRLDIMVNNAGINAEILYKSGAGINRIHETDVSILDKSLAVNVRGVWLGTKYATQQFLAQEPHSSGDRGWIVNLASVLSSVGMYGATSYCASKGAVLQLTRATSLEYARDGIHINAIQAGFTDTHLLENLYATDGKEAQKFLVSLHPWGRTGTPTDIAKLAVFLASEGAGWVTGSSIIADGGYLAQ